MDREHLAGLFDVKHGVSRNARRLLVHAGLVKANGITSEQKGSVSKLKSAMKPPK